MSIAVMNRVQWTQFENVSFLKRGKKISIDRRTAKLVMMALADSADDFGENSYNSFDTIAIKASCERRSAIRAIRGLIESGWISLAGISVYGTNNYKIHIDRLLEPPKRRARAGRPIIETSDSGAKTSDSGAKTSDSESPDPSLSIQNHPSVSLEERGKNRTKDLVDGAIELARMPGARREVRIRGWESLFAKALKGKSVTAKEWGLLFKEVDARFVKDGLDPRVFVDWMISTKDFDPIYWSAKRIRENYLVPFTMEEERAQRVVVAPSAPVDKSNIYVPSLSEKPKGIRQ